MASVAKRYRARKLAGICKPLPTSRHFGVVYLKFGTSYSEPRSTWSSLARPRCCSWTSPQPYRFAERNPGCPQLAPADRGLPTFFQFWKSFSAFRVSDFSNLHSFHFGMPSQLRSRLSLWMILFFFHYSEVEKTAEVQNPLPGRFSLIKPKTYPRRKAGRRRLKSSPGSKLLAKGASFPPPPRQSLISNVIAFSYNEFQILAKGKYVVRAGPAPHTTYKISCSSVSAM